MNIDEIIRKCVEVPGISIERGEYSAGLFNIFSAIPGTDTGLYFSKRSALDSTGFARRGL